LNPEYKRARRWSGQPFQFESGDSPVHRMGAGWKWLLAMGMAAAAVAAREPWTLGGLLALNLLLYRVAGMGFREIWLDLRFLLIQIIIVVFLYLIRYGPAQGFWPGLRTGLQILLLFVPWGLFLRTTQGSNMIRSLGRIMPARMSFLVFTSLRFVPFFARELGEIAMAQRLRGARIGPRQLMNPANWGDVFHCVMIPLIIRAVKTADEAALSAEARGFGRKGLGETK
jgi:energy-coupling factor transport system permease protein